MTRFILASAALLGLVGSATAQAAETITYRYDARGRLVRVERTGTVNNGVVTSYGLDKANNRLSRTKTP